MPAAINNDRICSMDIRYCKSSRNIEYTPDQHLILYERDRGSKDPKVAKRAGNRNAMGMMDTMVMFQDGADLEPTPTTSSQFLMLGTCTGHPQTHRTANKSIGKHLLRRRNNQIHVYDGCK